MTILRGIALPGKDPLTHNKNLRAILDEVAPLVGRQASNRAKSQVELGRSLEVNDSSDYSYELFWILIDLWPFVHWDGRERIPADRLRLYDLYTELRLCGARPFG